MIEAALQLPGGAPHTAAHQPPHTQVHLLDDPAEWESFGSPWPVASGAQQLAVWQSHVVIEGMYCAGCALTIEDALRAQPGVMAAEVSGAARRARVVWQAQHTRPSLWMAAIERAGYLALPARDGQARLLRQAQQRKALWRWLLATFCMMQVMMYAWPSYSPQPGDLLQEYENLLRWAAWVICIPMLVWACGPFFTGAWRSLRQGRVSMDAPVALGMLLTFVVSSWGTFAPEGAFGHEVFYDSLSMFVCFLLTGRWLESRLRERTAGALDAVMNRLPDSVLRRSPDGQWVRVAVRRLACGDVVRVLPGEAFVADGRIVQGSTHVDEALLTGESRALPRGIGQTVIAGSFNLTAPVQVQVQRLGAQTRFAEIVALMESAATQKPAWAQLADRVALPFLLVVLALAVASAAYWWPHSPGQALMIAAAVLIVTCPCALSLATPVAMLTAAGTLARRGVLVRHLQGLEALAQIDTVVLDKTGTLTSDGMAVVALQTVGAMPAIACQGLAAAIAQQSRHPVARAVARYGAAWAGHWQVLQVQEMAGHGLRAQVQSVGAQAPQIAPPVWMRLGAWHFAGGACADADQQAVYLAQEDAAGTLQPQACMHLSEGLRPEAAHVVALLQQQGLQVQLLSGDVAAAVQQAAHAVGIAQYAGPCTPDQKLAHLRALQQAGHKVAMVGDGLNDGPVLAGADVSLAFGQAVPLAQARADVVILGADLRLVVHSVVLARKTLQVVRQNLLGAAIYNAVCIPLAMVGWMPAWLAGLGMALSSLLVVLNAARLARPLPAERCADGVDMPAAQAALQVPSTTV